MLARMLLLEAFTALIAFGCSCAGQLPTCAAFGQIDAVFVGTVRSTHSQDQTRKADGKDIRFPGRRFVFEVIERFKGVEATNIDVHTGIGGGDCGWQFVKGSTYLVYAYRDQSSGQLETGICTRTNLADRAGEDLAQLRSLASRGPEGRVFGYVTTRRPNRWEPYTGDGALPGAPVWLRSDSGNKVKTVTDSRGEYSFDGLQPGKYAIWVDMPRKLGGGEIREISLASQACVYAPFFSKELGSISGVVLNALGEPVVHNWVELQSADGRKLIGVQDGFTDDGGRYRIQGVSEGTYLVGLSLRHTPSATTGLWHPFERNYYPGVRTAELARPVTVAVGQPVEGVNWRVGAPLERRSIRGIVVGPDGKAAYPVFVELKVEGYEDNAALAETRKDGSFTFAALKDLRYLVQASSGWREGSVPWHCHALRISGDDAPLTIKLDRPGKDCEECRKKR